MGKIVVIGASPNPARYSYKAVRALLKLDYEVVAIGNRKGEIGQLRIQTGLPVIGDVEKIILYVGASTQQKYLAYILSLNPGEILFNPGTENPELVQLALEYHIKIRYDCALMLIDNNIL